MSWWIRLCNRTYIRILIRMLSWRAEPCWAVHTQSSFTQIPCMGMHAHWGSGMIMATSMAQLKHASHDKTARAVAWPRPTKWNSMS